MRAACGWRLNPAASTRSCTRTAWLARMAPRAAWRALPDGPDRNRAARSSHRAPAERLSSRYDTRLVRAGRYALLLLVDPRVGGTRRAWRDRRARQRHETLLRTLPRKEASGAARMARRADHGLSRLGAGTAANRERRSLSGG